MARWSVYLDEDTFLRVRCAAEREHISLSQWARQRLAEGLETTWPAGTIDLLGSLSDADIDRPPQGSFADDLPREAL